MTETQKSIALRVLERHLAETKDYMQQEQRTLDETQGELNRLTKQAEELSTAIAALHKAGVA